MNLRHTMVAVAVGVSLVGLGVWYGGARAATAEPGSADDPLVTKSYVDQVVAGMVNKAYVDQAVANLANKEYVNQAVTGLVSKSYVDQTVDEKTAGLVDKNYLDTRLAAMNSLFQVVRVPKDAQILGESGTEIVLRGGKATAIVTAKGGLLDATDGVDLGQGEWVKPNHLLVVPVSDGRGLTAQADLILIVKGSYTVKAAGQ